ncbi:MAG: 16S rRNA (cytidine(1402)-2'-O)-methyltransferase [candidate division Zixibacteria bacterium]|nr:16S rRNA (cytidine(1402)-2'-O)-methyltransferase [candidate division Zixibacteria bacterium]
MNDSSAAGASGTLYLVPTPIGNLEDITGRARRILEAVYVVACEDSRVTGRLLSHLAIHARLISYHDYNERRQSASLLAFLKSGKDVAVVTDAGSPGISDPAYRIICAAIEASIRIVPLPGPTSIIPALTASGLPLDRFFFEGFAPKTAASRQKRFKELEPFRHTLVFLESPQRVLSTLRDAAAILGGRRACIARELSKLHEEFIRGTLPELIEALDGKKIRGEIVLIIAGKEKVKRVKVNKYKPD